MLRVTYLGALLITLVTPGCGDPTAVSEGAGGAGGVPMVDPGPTCTDFCAHVIGDCEEEAFPFTEASCRQGCQTSLNEEYQHDEACGEAAESVFQCATELDCQGVRDWLDQSPEGFPCQSEVSVFDALIVEGVCLPPA